MLFGRVDDKMVATRLRARSLIAWLGRGDVMKKRMSTALWACLLAVPLYCQPPAAMATGLMEAWRAAVQNDKEYAVARAAHAAAQPRRDQASALWRPTVGVLGSAGVASSESETRGAQFSAPAFGRSDGVGFSTSVTNGTASGWAVALRQPLYNPQRQAERRQLSTSVDLADLQWRMAGQALMLRTAERYFDLALAEESVRVHRQQFNAVQKAAVEAQDRFKLGDVPITDTHETSARLAALQAQLLAAESNLLVRRNLLADTTGLPLESLLAGLPDRSPEQDLPLQPLELWLDEAQANNPEIHGRLLAADMAGQEAAKHRRSSSATVDLVAQVGRERLSGSGDFGPAGNTGTNRMIGIRFSMPLYTGGYRSAKEAEALQLAGKAAAEVRVTRERIAQQMRSAWLGLSIGAERLRALEQALTASLARLAATRLGREVGERTTLDLLNAENESAASRLELAHARIDLLMSRLRMTALLGRLDEATLRIADGELAVPSRN